MSEKFRKACLHSLDHAVPYAGYKRTEEVANSPRSVHLSPSYPSAQLQVSFATQAPFSHGGSHTTGVGAKEEH